MEDAEVLELVMNDLKGMFGTSIPEPVAMKKTSWHTNPYSLGSYPHLKPGADLSVCDTIAAPLADKVFFAGDATSRKYMATAHGAYLSGIAAAESIMKSV
ncbi:MAG: FAD-dependent oxidoreductase [Chlorobi bacterium]|nr:FAD-dependent oxidoreductase [Chlorobiota bacterium]